MNIKEYNIDKDSPFKWKKHLILPMFRLRTIEEVQEEVHRYRTQEISFMIDDIKEDMQNSHTLEQVWSICHREIEKYCFSKESFI